jgi:hypothetical protein
MRTAERDQKIMVHEVAPALAGGSDADVPPAKGANV